MFKLRKALLQTINSLEEELEQEKQKNENLRKDQLILLDSNKELRGKIIDLENNIELLMADKENKKRRVSPKKQIKTNSSKK